jgi:hypothetical protein
VQKDFCNTIGTKRTCRDDLLFVRFRGEADIGEYRCSFARREI